MLFEGDDLGRWLQRQTRDWSQLTEEQQRRLSELGITPAEQPSPATATNAAKGTGKASAFQRGLAALAQWIQREGTRKAVPRGHIETVVVDGQEHQHKLGVWTSNTRARRDKLTSEQQAALAALGVPWAKAAAVPAPSGGTAPLDDGPVRPCRE